MLVPLSGDAPLHLQIYRAFRQAILSGRLSPGERLPSSRSEARLLGISRNVVLQAYDQLTAEGYLTGAIGAGTFVARDFPEERPSSSAPSFTALSSFAQRAHNKQTSRPKDLPYDFVYGLSRREIVEILLTAGADRSIQDVDGYSPHSWAGWHRRSKELVELLRPS